jgi:hypothetical protein
MGPQCLYRHLLDGRRELEDPHDLAVEGTQLDQRTDPFDPALVLDLLQI